MIASNNIYSQSKIDTLNICENYIRLGADFKYKYSELKELSIIKDNLIKEQINLNDKNCKIDKKLLNDKINLSNKKGNKKSRNRIILVSLIGFITGLIIK